MSWKEIDSDRERTSTDEKLCRFFKTFSGDSLEIGAGSKRSAEAESAEEDAFLLFFDAAFPAEAAADGGAVFGEEEEVLRGEGDFFLPAILAVVAEVVAVVAEAAGDRAAEAEGSADESREAEVESATASGVSEAAGQTRSASLGICEGKGREQGKKEKG